MVYLFQNNLYVNKDVFITGDVFWLYDKIKPHDKIIDIRNITGNLYIIGNLYVNKEAISYSKRKHDLKDNYIYNGDFFIKGDVIVNNLFANEDVYFRYNISKYKLRTHKIKEIFNEENLLFQK